MTRGALFLRRVVPALVVGTFMAACGSTATQPGSTGSTDSAGSAGSIGVEPAQLSPVIDNPYIAFAQVRRAVYEGTEGGTAIRVEHTVRDTTSTVAGAEVTVVDVSEFEDGELVEQTEDYYAQDAAGVVYYMGERVNDYENGQVVGHSGQWLAGENGNPAGVFMPAQPAVGDEFEQERAPGIAEDRSKVLAEGITVTVPAGSFTDCIETEDVDPIGGVTERKYYCASVGLVREAYGDGSLELVEYEPR